MLIVLGPSTTAGISGGVLQHITGNTVISRSQGIGADIGVGLHPFTSPQKRWRAHGDALPAGTFTRDWTAVHDTDHVPMVVKAISIVGGAAKKAWNRFWHGEMVRSGG